MESQTGTNFRAGGQRASYFLTTAKMSDNKIRIGQGMGVAVFYRNQKLYLLTAYHMVHEARFIEVKPWSGEPGMKKSITARVEIMVPDADLSLISIPWDRGAPPPVHARLKKAETQTSIGDILYTFGQPIQNIGLMSHGIVSGYLDIDPIGYALVSNAVTTPGFSGAGVFNQHGDLVGIVSGKSTDTRTTGFTYVIPVARAMDMISAVTNETVAARVDPKQHMNAKLSVLGQTHTQKNEKH
ncbi:S1 family peptidase [Desulfobacter latus]|uniref:Trypsin-like peptidase domain-containing protein n=1 Tax=Desulfobacter latus TaxID=2292 RepID=A0A850TD28_9BACT|nr:serine protease [Desulfobacter latus]NWH06177.1 trypsin-like peptidase domain-containing protein [Desulfobacter latus]